VAGDLEAPPPPPPPVLSYPPHLSASSRPCALFFHCTPTPPFPPHSPPAIAMLFAAKIIPSPTTVGAHLQARRPFSPPSPPPPVNLPEKIVRFATISAVLSKSLICFLVGGGGPQVQLAIQDHAQPAGPYLRCRGAFCSARVRQRWSPYPGKAQLPPLVINSFGY